MSSLEVSLSVTAIMTGISLTLVSFVDSWGWGRRSLQLLTHTLARFPATLTGLGSIALGLRKPYRVAVLIMDILFTVMRELEQELFAVEVREMVYVITTK